jgi:hypothetical protein
MEGSSSSSKQSKEQSKEQGSSSSSSGKVKEPEPATAPGPIHPDHESGSWEQTLAEQEARAKAREDSRKNRPDRSESRRSPGDR